METELIAKLNRTCHKLLTSDVYEKLHWGQSKKDLTHLKYSVASGGPLYSVSNLFAGNKKKTFKIFILDGKS